MKSFKIPAPITFKDPETGETMKDLPVGDQPAQDAVAQFPRFVRQSIMWDPRWSQSTEWIWSAGCILSALSASQQSGEFQIDDEHMERLKEVAKVPVRVIQNVGAVGAYSLLYNPLVLPQLQPFFDVLK